MAALAQRIVVAIAGGAYGQQRTGCPGRGIVEGVTEDLGLVVQAPVVEVALDSHVTRQCCGEVAFGKATEMGDNG